MEDRIVDLIKSNQEDGIKLLQQQYSGLMHYIVANILSDRSDIEECISDICIKVWSSIDRYSKEKGKFTTWLTAISRNTALNYLRRKQENYADLKEDCATSPSPEHVIFQQEQMEALKQILSTLSTEERHLLYRKYYYLQQTAQIAAELGMSVRSVEGKLYRLKNKLRKRLEVISHE